MNKVISCLLCLLLIGVTTGAWPGFAEETIPATVATYDPESGAAAAIAGDDRFVDHDIVLRGQFR